MYNRPAIAMIELIFAIVIMGIVLMSAPMLISTATKSTFVGMQQESIATAASEMGMILTRHWDEGNTDTNDTAPILTTAGDSGLNANGTTGRRAGTPTILSHRSFFLAGGGTRAATSVANFKAEGDFDDIDDFHLTTSELSTYNGDLANATIGDFIDKNITIGTTVSYIEDNTTNGATYFGSSSIITFNNPFNRISASTSNIKWINVNLTTNNTAAELDKNIILNAFSCNIGTYELNERSF